MSDSDISNAPQVQMPDDGPAPSVLSQAAGTPQTPTLNESGDVNNSFPTPSTGGPSRLMSTLAAIVSTGLSGIPDKGRPSFVTGLGSGARAAQAAQANQQAIKFRNYDDSVRAAQLAVEEKHAQNADEEHQAHMTEFAQSQADRMTANTGMTYTYVRNDDDGSAVLNHLQTGMANSPDGKVSVPPGTIPAPDGWLVPNKGSDEVAQANTKDFNSRAPFYGFNPTPSGQVVKPFAYDSLTQQSRGYKLQADGHTAVMTPEEIRDLTDNMSSELAKYKQRPNADPNTIAAVQQDMDHLNGLADIHEQRNNDAISKAQQQSATGAGLNAGAIAKAQFPYKDQLQQDKSDNANGGGGNSTTTGLDFLKTLPPQRASSVQAIGEGRMELTPSMLRSKDGQTLAQQVTTAYPDFDQSKAQSYFKTRQDFTSGKTSVAINSYNTAIAHLGTMYDHVSGTNSLQLNNPAADVSRQLDLDKQLVSTELAKAVSNSQMTEGEKKDILCSISGYTVGSYQTRIQEAVQLLNGKLESYQQQWNNGAPPGAVSKVCILSPQSEQTIARINGQPSPSQQGGSQSGKSVSLAAARQLPAMQGKTDDQITAAIQAQGHQVIP